MTSNRATTTAIRGQQARQQEQGDPLRRMGEGGGDGPRIRIQLKNVYSAIAVADRRLKGGQRTHGAYECCIVLENSICACRDSEEHQGGWKQGRSERGTCFKTELVFLPSLLFYFCDASACPLLATICDPRSAIHDPRRLPSSFSCCLNKLLSLLALIAVIESENGCLLICAREKCV